VWPSPPLPPFHAAVVLVTKWVFTALAAGDRTNNDVAGDDQIQLGNLLASPTCQIAGGN
jgi:hypothetical protein